MKERQLNKRANHLVISILGTLSAIGIALWVDGWITPDMISGTDDLFVVLGFIIAIGVPALLALLWFRFILRQIKLFWRAK
jgi:hypothetical protein